MMRIISNRCSRISKMNWMIVIPIFKLVTNNLLLMYIKIKIFRILIILANEKEKSNPCN